MTALTITARNRASATRFLAVIGNEIRKGLLFAWAERVQMAMEIPFFAFMTLLLGPIIGSGHQVAAGHLSWTLNSHRTSTLLLTFAAAMWLFFLGAKMFWRLLAEIQTGTIEQVYLSPLPSWLVAVAGRLIAAIIESLILLGVMYGIVSAFVTLHFHWTAAALIPAVFLVITGIGYTLIIAGMTLLWKRIALLVDIALLLVMVFAFSAVPLITVPGWFAGIGRAFPVTSVVASMYGVMLGHRGVTGLWGTGGLVELAVTAAAYLAAGLIVFRVLERITRVRGILGAY